MQEIISIKAYSLVFVILLALAVTTTLLIFVDLGPFSLVLSLGIAAGKALLVYLFFMGGLHSPKLTRVVAVGALVWLGILLSLTLGDYITRGWLPVPGK